MLRQIESPTTTSHDRMNCAIEPGRTACDRCIRKRITCGLPPARLQEIQTGVHEDMSATSKQMKNKDSIDNRALFLNLKPECYTPASFSQLTDEDWKNIRQFIVLQMCTILANTDSELWEVGEFPLPLPGKQSRHVSADVLFYFGLWL